MTGLVRLREEVIIDRPQAVEGFLRNLHRRGELAEWHLVGRAIEDPTRVVVRYTMLQAARRPALPVRAPARRRWSTRTRVAVAGAVATTLTVLGWAVYVVVTAILAHLAMLLGVGLVVVLALWFGAGRVGCCPGVHCVGCRCR